MLCAPDGKIQFRFYTRKFYSRRPLVHRRARYNNIHSRFKSAQDIVCVLHTYLNRLFTMYILSKKNMYSFTTSMIINPPESVDTTDGIIMFEYCCEINNINNNKIVHGRTSDSLDRTKSCVILQTLACQHTFLMLIFLIHSISPYVSHSK